MSGDADLQRVIPKSCFRISVANSYVGFILFMASTELCSDFWTSSSKALHETATTTARSYLSIHLSRLYWTNLSSSLRGTAIHSKYGRTRVGKKAAVLETNHLEVQNHFGYKEFSSRLVRNLNVRDCSYKIVATSTFKLETSFPRRIIISIENVSSTKAVQTLTKVVLMSSNFAFLESWTNSTKVSHYQS